MSDEEKEAILYRFEGYQLPLIQLDETGPAYVVLQPHPYYYNQPLVWQKPASYGQSLPTTSNVIPISPGSGSTTAGDSAVRNNPSPNNKGATFNGPYRMLGSQ